MGTTSSILETPAIDVVASLEYWRSAVSGVAWCFNVDTLDSQCFRARLERKNIGAADIITVTTTPQYLQRTRNAIALDHERCITLNLVLEGRIVFGQWGREGLAKAGDCFLVDTANPYFHHCPDTLRAMSLCLPRRWVDRHLPNVDDLVARRIDGGHGWGRATTALLMALNETNNVSFSSAAMLEQMMQLVFLSLDGGQAGTTTHQNGLLRRARSQMNERWDEEGLTPTDIACDLGVSRSYLHSLFSKAGTTFCTELAAIRVEKACALLGPAGGRLTVAEVAFRCGFASAAHFSRKFRMAKGMSPTDFRSLRRVN